MLHFEELRVVIIKEDEMGGACSTHGKAWGVRIRTKFWS
jgi:hypothetical protein